MIDNDNLIRICYIIVVEVPLFDLLFLADLPSFVVHLDYPKLLFGLGLRSHPFVGYPKLLLDLEAVEVGSNHSRFLFVVAVPSHLVEVLDFPKHPVEVLGFPRVLVEEQAPIDLLFVGVGVIFVLPNLLFVALAPKLHFVGLDPMLHFAVLANHFEGFQVELVSGESGAHYFPFLAPNH